MVTNPGDNVYPGQQKSKNLYKIWCPAKNVADPFHQALPKVLPITYVAKCFYKSRRPEENKKIEKRNSFRQSGIIES